jgi:chromosome segregation ATPase
MSDTTPLQAHRSQEATIAVVLERLKGIDAKCDRCIEQNDDITRQVAKIDTDLALGNQRMESHEDRMDAIDTHLEATDTRVSTVESDRRATAGIWGGIIALLTAIGSYFK